MRCCYDNNTKSRSVRLNLIITITTLASHSHLINAFLSPITKPLTSTSHYYVPPSSITTKKPFITSTKRHLLPFDDEVDDDDDPYAELKRQYPDLEFVDYSNPDYVVDQGLDETSSSALPPDATEAAIEDMREDRRRRNDEYQFETYFSKTLNNGGEYRGEWTIYDVLPSETTTDGDVLSLPRLAKRSEPLTVTSFGKKVIVNPDADWRVDGEVIVHEEKVVKTSKTLLRKDEESDTLYVRNDDDDDDDDGVVVDDLSLKTYWPDQMTSRDFRGPMGNMVVGNAYTVCRGIPLAASENNDDDDNSGPYSQFRTEVGLHYDDLRFRIKLDYRTTTTTTTTTSEGSSSTPPLLLSSLTVCRETRSPSALPCPTTTPSFFFPPGAPGGLYDPPPVGSSAQAQRYTTVDLPGGATILFPFRMDQDLELFGGQGWVVSLDWTPGPIRYQVDRKMEGGVDVKGIYRLELSEVKGEDADEYRPNDGGVDMRQ